MRHFYPISSIIISILICCFACQSTRLPDAKIQRDPSPQLNYRYTNEAKGFSFDFPYYGLRFFKKMDKKAAILTHNLGIKSKNIQFYNSMYLSHHMRLMTVLYEKPVKSATIIAANVKRLQSKKMFSKVEFIEKPKVKIDPSETIIINNYEIKLDSNIALAQIKYYAQLDKSDFLCSEFYVELHDKSLLRLINFVNIDTTLFDETDRSIDSTDYFKRTIVHNLAYFKQPIPPLNFTGNIQQPFALANKSDKDTLKNRYIERINVLQNNSALYDTLRPEYKNQFYQGLMTYYSLAGYNEEALAMRDSAMGFSRPDSCNALTFKDLKIENAIDYICKQLPNRRLVMLNEAHHLPMCRLFALQLLDSLKKNGFNYLALETLIHNNKINKRGFPALGDGFYQQEPMFAEFIRQAVLKGFKIIDYDDSGDTTECLPPPDAHRFYCNNLREEGATKRIAAVFKADPKAKVFVYVGHAHNYKDYYIAQRQRREGQKWKFLAIQLKEKLGFDPLSINQVDMVERSIKAYEDPMYRCVWREFAPEESVVLVKRDGKSWLKPDFETMLDAYVFHPRTSQEIPYEWLGKVGFKKYNLDVSDIKDGYLTQVFYKKELDVVNKKAIPALNLPMRGATKLELWLRPNTAYIIQIYAKDSRLIKEIPFGFMP
jgi:hypothetical protein